MSDARTQDDKIAEQIANDARFDAIRLGIDVEAGMRNGALRVIYDAFKRDAEVALLEFAEASLGDAKQIMDLQARVYRSVKAVRTIDAIRKAQQSAQADVLAEERGERLNERHDD